MSVDSIWINYSNEISVHKNEYYEYFRGTEVGYAIMLGEFHPLTQSIGVGDLLRDYHISIPQSYSFVGEAETNRICAERR